MLFAIVQEGCLTYVGGLLRGVSIAPSRQLVEPQKDPRWLSKQLQEQSSRRVSLKGSQRPR